VIDLTTDDLEPEKSLSSEPLLMEATVQDAKEPVPLLPNAEGTAQLCLVADVLEPLLASARAIAGEQKFRSTGIPQLATGTS